MNVIRYGAVLATILAFCATQAQAQPAGVSPPEDVFVEASLSNDGISLSTDQVALKRGEYY